MIPIPDEDLNSTAAVKKITDEDILYSTLIESHPALESLVNRFDLCSVKTGDRFIKTGKRVTVRTQQTSTTSVGYSMLMILAAQVLTPEEDYKQNEVIEAIRKETKVSKAKAAKKFDLMVDAGVITEGSLAGHFCFNHSTPF